MHQAVTLRGAVGKAAFVLEIPPGAVLRAGKMLELSAQRECADELSPIEKRLMDLLGEQALRLAMEAQGYDEYEWRMNNFRWESDEGAWRRCMPWSTVAGMIDPQGADGRLQELRRLAQEIVASVGDEE